MAYANTRMSSKINRDAVIEGNVRYTGRMRIIPIRNRI